MDLKQHFESRHGTGVLSTADAEVRVDAAFCSRRHVFDDGTVAVEKVLPLVGAGQG